MKKDFIPFLSLMVVIFSSFIILFTPLRPKVSFVQPDLKLLPTPVLEYKSQKISDLVFEYPQSLTFSDNRLTLPQGNQIVFYTQPDTSKTIAEYLVKQDKISQTAWENQPSLQVLSTKKTVINGLNCIQRQEKLLSADMEVISTYFKKGNSVYKIQLQGLSDIAIYNQILNSIKIN